MMALKQEYRKRQLNAADPAKRAKNAGQSTKGKVSILTNIKNVISMFTGCKMYDTLYSVNINKIS